MNKVIKNPFERMQKGAVVALCVVFLALAGSFASCSKKVESSTQGIYYVVGYDGATEVILQNGTARSETFLFLSENLKDSLFAYNWNPVDSRYYDLTGSLFDNFIDIPTEILSNSCGIAVFPEEFRFACKVYITYRQITEEEIARNLTWGRVVIDICPPDILRQKFKPIIITSISKIE